VSHQSIHPAENGFSHYEWQHDATILSESLEFAATNSGTCEDILEWSIFEGEFHRTDTEALIFNPNLFHSQTTGFADPFGLGPSILSNSIRKSDPGRGVQESDALALVQRFLANVHIKNPILDAEEMAKKARDVMENGFRWDGTSCLVVCTLSQSIHHSNTLKAYRMRIGMPVVAIHVRIYHPFYPGRGEHGTERG
jgi:hypothetical protein